MANSDVLLQRLCSVFSFTFLVLMGSFLTTIATINGINRSKIVLRLIHRDSIFPLFYHPNLTISDHTNHAINCSRAAYSLAKSDGIRSPLVPDKNGALFLVNVSIGEPPVPQLLAMDTGSSLTWVQCPRPLCAGCKPHALNPIYDPKSSSTCTTLSCDSRHQCINYFDHSDCGKESECIYDISYLDESRSRGIMALDKFTFMTSTGGISEVPDLLFGCGLDSHGTVLKLSGILGLQVLNRYSLVSRVGKKFSYCIGNISDPHYVYSQLILGEGAILEGYSTPMVIRHGHYVVSLEGISVGEKQLQINQKEFDFNVVIDSGSTITSLERNAFEALKEEVMKLLDGLLQPVIAYKVGDRLCYRGDMVRDLKGFPTVTLHLAQGTDLSLDVEGMFRRVSDNIFCMAVDVSRYEMGIIGLIAQQYHNIGFDLNAMRVSFLSIECELLED